MICFTANLEVPCSIEIYQRSQHTPETGDPVISLERPYPYTIITGARRKQYHRERRDPRIWEVAPTSPARILLSRVRQYVELDVDRHGHKPAIMDIILKLMSPMQDDEDTLMDDIERIRRLNQSHPEYGRVFKDAESLHAYWDHQVHIAAMQHDAPVLKAMFNTSAERSTAGWSAGLSGDASDDDRDGSPTS
jgi:hypothetical protein